MNLKSVRTWFSNIEDPRIHSFFSTNMWHNENSQADVKNFIKEHSGTLAGFIFHYQGLTIQMHWKEKDIYEYFKEYKHSQRKTKYRTSRMVKMKRVTQRAQILESHRR